ncbi:DUF1772 domain-containing protein [Aspergillus novofumigatus IBT 16806]|uniref:DUF1772-domain-containing protein n=1 Tax=Aspergillus novofumigatus (strain IBT 16806) TaxID=1392255 RepID=A0A2I1BX53_ASPN1|nr:DUF1772-domain-containing protein [Aspergillus novofumigatus IBT 16806]PKX89947.1 DUF1772-domain-containing protein [Aspergillus novofumigatus IBT 16806]
MSDLPTRFRVAQMIGTLGASWLSGNMAALSLISMPALILLQSEDQIPSVDVCKYFRRILEKGGVNPPLIAMTACANGYLAWSYRPGGWCRRIFPDVDMTPYLAAAALTFSILPFTVIAIIPINKALGQRAEGLEKKNQRKSGPDDTQELLRKWIFRNGVRSLLGLTAAAITLGAVL